MPKTQDPPGPAWFRHRMHDGTRLRVFLKGWFTPLTGTVDEVEGNQVRLAGKWFCASGPKRNLHSVEAM